MTVRDGCRIGIVGYFWVQDALVALVQDVRDRRADRSVGETYAAVQPQLRALIAAAPAAPTHETETTEA